MAELDSSRSGIEMMIVAGGRPRKNSAENREQRTENREQRTES
jgi:hypothetical protein